MTKLTQAELEAIRKRAEAAPVYNDSYLLKVTDDYASQFYKHAREDVPKLVEALLQERAEVERLRSALQEIADIDDWDYGLEKAKNITFKAINMPEGWA